MAPPCDKTRIRRKTKTQKEDSLWNEGNADCLPLPCKDLHVRIDEGGQRLPWRGKCKQTCRWAPGTQDKVRCRCDGGIKWLQLSPPASGSVARAAARKDAGEPAAAALTCSAVLAARSHQLCYLKRFISEQMLSKQTLQPSVLFISGF